MSITVKFARAFIFCLALLGCITESVMAAPVVSSFSPASGIPGVQVTILGSQFTGSTLVTLNDQPVDFSVTAPNQILAIVPTEATSGKFAVFGPSGTGLSAGSFVVAPRIDDFFPTRAATNSLIAIFGANFLGVTNVTFGDSNATFTVLAANQITAMVPAGLTTNGLIAVFAPVGSNSSPSQFVLSTPAPILESFEPTAAAPGTEVLIVGANFTGVTQVKFGSTAASFTVPAQTQIRAIVPAAGVTGPITVTTAKGSVVSTDSFVVTRAPVIYDFTPTVGVPGGTVTITGINFSNILGVGFNGKVAAGYGMAAENQITAIVPQGATDGRISVTNKFGSGISAQNFRVTKAPLIEEFNPTFGPVGTRVTFTGRNFTGASEVTFPGEKKSIPSVVADTQLHVTVPSGATSGPVRIKNAFGTNESAGWFLVTGSGPFITGFAPAVGPRGTPVVIEGVNLDGATKVAFNGVAAQFFAAGPNQIQTTAPAGVTTGPIQVTTPAGANTTAGLFFAPPRLTGFSPTNGIAGDTITVTGTNFNGFSEITLNGATIPVLSSSNNTLKLLVATNSRSGILKLVTPAGVIYSTSAYHVLPHIDSFSPTIGSPGVKVTIRGTSFYDVSAVTFNGSPAVFTVLSPAEISATIPAGASSGLVQVVAAEGKTTSTNNLTVTGASDLEIQVTGPTGRVDVGQSYTYSIKIDNLGNEAMSGVTMKDPLPTGLTLLSMNSSAGALSFTNRIVTCDIGLFNKAGHVEVSLQVRPDIEAVFTNQVTVTAVEPDLEPTSNTSQTLTYVYRDASRTLKIEKGSLAGTVVLSWPTSAIPYRVQYLDDLKAVPFWLDLPTGPYTVGNRFVLTNSVDGAARFYRLTF